MYFKYFTKKSQGKFFTETSKSCILYVFFRAFLRNYFENKFSEGFQTFKKIEINNFWIFHQ